MELLLGYEYPEIVRELFEEYTEYLIENNPEIKTYLGIQGFDDEILHLEKKYGPPLGRLYLVKEEDHWAGCIALRPMEEKKCEMKRLYIRPEFEGLGLGRKLIEKTLEDAKEIGYESIWLDTMPFLKRAIHLYKSFGFEEVPCYNDSPIESTIYMKKDL